MSPSSGFVRTCGATRLVEQAVDVHFGREDDEVARCVGAEKGDGEVRGATGHGAGDGGAHRVGSADDDASRSVGASLRMRGGRGDVGVGRAARLEGVRESPRPSAPSSPPSGRSQTAAKSTSSLRSAPMTTSFALWRTTASLMRTLATLWLSSRSSATTTMAFAVVDAGHVGGHAPGARSALRERASMARMTGPSELSAAVLNAASRWRAARQRFFVGDGAADEDADFALRRRRLERLRGFGDGVVEASTGPGCCPRRTRCLREALARLQRVVVVAPAHADLVAADGVAVAGPDDDAAPIRRPDA